MQQDPGAEKSEDSAGTRYARPNPHGLIAFRLWEGGGQQRQRRGHDECGAGACHRPRDDDLNGAVEYHRRNGGQSEDGQTDEQCAAAPIPVADGARRQQQARQHQRVSVDDPGELALGRGGLHSEIRKCRVQRDHRRDHQQHVHAGDRQQPETRAFGAGGDAGRRYPGRTVRGCRPLASRSFGG